MLIMTPIYIVKKVRSHKEFFLCDFVSSWLSLFFICLTSVSLSSQSFSFITDESHPFKGCIELSNPTIEGKGNVDSKDLQVFLFSENSDKASSPIIGSWERVDNSLYFCPLIPFSRKLTYQARYPSLSPFNFQPEPEKDYTKTTLTHVFPSLDTLPENTLKMYLHFSAPMSDVNAYQYIVLKDEKGEKIEVPFLELTPLLWNYDRTRLTIWFDPGRVKRELLRNQKLGAPLEEGKSYTLQISKNWKDANGYLLADNFTKKLRITKADRIAPDTEHWSTTLPKSNSKSPLIIHFGEPMDHALLQKSLTVLDENGDKIEGKSLLRHHDMEWLFTPTLPWKLAKYRVQINSKLEDLAGNNFNRLFDTNLENQEDSKKELPYYYFDFLVD